MPEKKTGRPPIANPKNVRLEIRLTQAQSELLQRCAEMLQMSKTDVINKGIAMVADSLQE